MVKLKPAVRTGQTYQNPVETRVGGLRIMFKALPLLLTNREEKVPRVPIGPFKTDSRIYDEAPGSGLRVTWFGHSASLLEIDGMRVLVDPVWDQRAAPVSWLGPKRFFAPTIALEDLPSLDAVLISHDHYDHLGKRTVQSLARLRPGLRWVTSLGVGTELVAFGVSPEQIVELNWTESTQVEGTEGRKLQITSVPARHFSGRSLGNRNHTLWGSFVFAGPTHRVYYGADSGLWDGFQAIGEQYGPFDLCMLEIGAFNELWRDIHLGPEGAAEAFRQLGSGLMMPIHWGLFDLALHAWREPIEDLTTLADGRRIPLFAPTPGVPTEVHLMQEVRSKWWRGKQ